MEVAGVGKNADGKRAGEPDEIFAAGNAGEIAGELVHGIERVFGAKLELEGLLLRVELPEVGDEFAVGAVPMSSMSSAMLFGAASADRILEQRGTFPGFRGETALSIPGRW